VLDDGDHTAGVLAPQLEVDVYRADVDTVALAEEESPRRALMTSHAEDGVRHVIEVQLGTADTDQVNRALVACERS
jgi:hypothetical protein